MITIMNFYSTYPPRKLKKKLMMTYLQCPKNTSDLLVASVFEMYEDAPICVKVINGFALITLI